MCSGPPAVSRSVTVCDEAVVPSVTEPNESSPGRRVTCGVEMPFPQSGTVCGLSGALSPITRFADSLAAAGGPEGDVDRRTTRPAQDSPG